MELTYALMWTRKATPEATLLAWIELPFDTTVKK